MRRQPPQERDVKQPSGERLHDALAFVRARLEALKSVPADPPFNDEFVKWDRLTAAGIQDYFGKDSQEFGWVFVGSSGTVVIRSEAQREALDRKRYPEVLRNRRMGLETVLERYEALPPTWGDQVSPVKRRTRAFISHGGEKPSLTFIQNFLRALGVDPIVVDKRASEGREVHDNVDRYRKQSDFAVILWTKDMQDNQDAWHPSGSVEIEVGELRIQFAGRVIYLKEDGVTLPAMASTLVYERFAEGDMGQAFAKIATELRDWGWLKVSPTEATHD